jgi:hypothetical protein
MQQTAASGTQSNVNFVRKSNAAATPLSIPFRSGLFPWIVDSVNENNQMAGSIANVSVWAVIQYPLVTYKSV